MGEEMIALTIEQRERLMAVANRVPVSRRERMSLAESNSLAKAIDEVLYELHMENPRAFLTAATKTLNGKEFLSVESVNKERMFYDEPRKLHSKEYRSYIVPAPKEL